jgi:hypothetical protein
MAALSSYTPIATYTFPSAASSYTLSSIPATYTDLVIVVNGTASGADYSVGIECNGDGATNYSYTLMQGNGSTATSARGSSETYATVGTLSNVQSTSIIQIMNYANTTTHKTFLGRGNSSAERVRAYAAIWRSTSAINAIKLVTNGANFTTGTTISLYGIANNTAGAKATGGVISSDSSYFYHSFYATGTFTPSSALTGADVLVVGGGGGASSGSAAGMGGGGAGGYRALASQSFASGTAYTCTVGSGGAGASYAAAGGTGTGSSLAGTGFTTISASAGGAGSAYGATGSNGGSGGGGSGTGTFAGGSGNSGSYSPVEGFAGGGGRQSGAYYTGGGGGGASAVGADATSGSLGGNGGAGTQWYNGNYYAGGGGGGNNQVAAIATGGSSIGGNGGLASSTAATNGVINTGSGGGGGAGLAGAAGGSGVVIIRYAR